MWAHRNPNFQEINFLTFFYSWFLHLGCFQCFCLAERTNVYFLVLLAWLMVFVLAFFLDAKELSGLWHSASSVHKYQVLFEQFELSKEMPKEMLKQAEKKALERVTLTSSGKPSTPPRKSRKATQPPGDGPETPEGKGTVPKHVQGCRPAGFGQPKSQETVLKAAKGRTNNSVPEKQPETDGEIGEPASKRKKPAEEKDPLAISGDSETEEERVHSLFHMAMQNNENRFATFFQMRRNLHFVE